MDRVHWLFMVLTFGDMASALLGTTFVEDSTIWVLRFVTVQQQLLGAESSNSVRTMMVETVMNLKSICHTLGVGSFFFLKSVLIEDLQTWRRELRSTADKSSCAN